jgi:hypothetical protein
LKGIFHRRRIGEGEAGGTDFAIRKLLQSTGRRSSRNRHNERERTARRTTKSVQLNQAGTASLLTKPSKTAERRPGTTE